MARPTKIGLPKWNPSTKTISKFGSHDLRVRYKALRNSSSAFIKREDVRKFVFQKCHYKCSKCSSAEYLSIDHITSVYQTALLLFPIEKLNKEENLTVLCINCNSKKNP
jgi:5-methylcytosine-specific restriction endonuclease McrA